VNNLNEQTFTDKEISILFFAMQEYYMRYRSNENTALYEKVKGMRKIEKHFCLGCKANKKKPKLASFFHYRKREYLVNNHSEHKLYIVPVCLDCDKKFNPDFIIDTLLSRKFTF
jgi:hypothetical protein